MSRELGSRGLSLLNYIDDFGGEGVTISWSEAESHFALLQGLLETLGLQEAHHKTFPLSQVMVWLGFQFDTLAMTVTLPPDKLQEIMDLVDAWFHKTMANIHDLMSLLGKLFFLAQCCPPARLFTNRMLETGYFPYVRQHISHQGLSKIWPGSSGICPTQMVCS